MKHSHGAQKEERIEESCNSASGTGQDQHQTQVKFSVYIIRNFTCNKTEEGIWYSVDETDEETVPVLELRIGGSDFIDWIISHLTETSVTIGIVETLSLPLDHNTSSENNEKNEV